MHNQHSDPSPRHQCLIYEGAPSLQLRALAAAAAEKLQQNYRCLCLNTLPMVAGMRSYLSAIDIDVEREMRKGSLVLSSARDHLRNGSFDIDGMIRALEEAIRAALADGYAGLWATGDMSWELGGDCSLATILDYEWRLERLFSRYPQLSGICQYHAGSLPPQALRQATHTHPGIFLNESLSMRSPNYCFPSLADSENLAPADREAILARLR